MKQTFSLKQDGKKQAPLSNGQLSKYFQIMEFKNTNPRIDVIVQDTRTTDLLDAVRRHFGVPVFIAVANRNDPYNSYHNPNFADSTACDFDVGNSELGTIDYEVACRFLEKEGATGLGCYNLRDAKGVQSKWIHLDCRHQEPKSFWRCNGLNAKGEQVLTKISTFLLPFPIPTRNLRWIQKTAIFRMHGNDVKWLQTALNMSKLREDLVVDGDFAGLTDLYVRDFQKKFGLTVDGNAGPMTVSVLRDVYYL